MPNAQISELIHKNAPFLNSISKTKSYIKLKNLLKSATTQELLSLAEISLNIVTQRFQLTNRQKKRLIPYADFVRRMSRLRTEKGARKLLIQRGAGSPGIFAALITPILIELARQLYNGK